MWPKGPTYWMEGRHMCVSIPFTFDLPTVRNELSQVNMFWDTAEVGGPAVALMPDFFSDMPWVSIGKSREGVLQRINPLATRTTLGCTRSCGFCAIGTGRVEGGGMVELPEWENLPIKCDNNILAASDSHIGRSLEEDIERGFVDYNQGLDARYITDDIAKLFGKIKKPTVRLSFDMMPVKDKWLESIEILTRNGVTKSNISTYALVGFRETPEDSWRRCEEVTKRKIQIYPMWYHRLDALERNVVTDEQKEWGWTEKDRTHIMGYYYKRRGIKPAYLNE